MSTKTTNRTARRELAEAVMAQSRRAEQRMRLAIWGVVLVSLAGIVGAMLLTSTPQSSSDVRTAPDFTLTDTSGAEHTLADHRGENVLLYFNEGDDEGQQRWYGEYPSMWLDPRELLDEVRDRLDA